MRRTEEVARADSRRQTAICGSFDVTECLRTPKDIGAYLEASIEEPGDDPAFIAKVLGLEVHFQVSR